MGERVNASAESTRLSLDTPLRCGLVCRARLGNEYARASQADDASVKEPNGTNMQYNVFNIFMY